MSSNPVPAAIDAFENVADSTDWLSTPLSGLAAVEAALRCQVCKDFYRTPMLTSCNHTFCSMCIRRALSNEGKCPLCRVSDQETKLRSNWSMEEVVATFTQTRPAILDFAQRPLAITPREQSPKRKLDQFEDAYETDSSPQRSSKRLRSSTRLSKSRSMEATAEMARQEVGIPDSEPSYFDPEDGLVACPICWRRMKPLQVDKHLDTSCPGEPRPEPSPPRQASRTSTIPSAFPSTSSRQQPPSRPLERLPALNYSSLKEQQLRKKVAELGISTGGSRQSLERRHKEWVTIWNANCDSLRPRRKADLLHELDVWERTLGTRAPTSSRSAILGAQIRDKEFDGAAWAARHDSSFKDLIASARRTKAQVREEKTELKTEEGQERKIGPTPGHESEVIDLTDDKVGPIGPHKSPNKSPSGGGVASETIGVGSGTTAIS